MKIFISGIRGFIGGHLANYFKLAGCEVSGIDNNFHPTYGLLDESIDCYDVDIRDKSFITETHIANADIVYHLAAQINIDYSIKYPVETTDINVNGTINILELCRKYKKKVIVASTSEVYGSSQTEYMTEQHPLDAQSPYAASKVACDRMCKAYIDTYGMDIVIVRNFNVFGPFQNEGSYGSVIAKFTKAAYKGEPIKIFGDGSQERDYMYVTDAVQAYKHAITLPAGVYNFGTGKTVTVNEIAHTIKHRIMSRSKIEWIAPRAGEVLRLCAGIDKVKEHGFSPSTDFKRDLDAYILWYETVRSAE